MVYHYPSYSRLTYGQHTVLLEALFLGVPVVNTNGSNKILVDELADFLSPVSEVNALAKNIAKMMINTLKNL